MNQKGFSPLIIVLGILLIIGIAGGVYYFGKSQSAKPEVLPSSNPVVIAQTPQPTQKVSEIQEKKDSNLYINHEGEYSFEYPKDWFVMSAKDAYAPDYKAAKGETLFSNKLDKNGKIPSGISVDKQTVLGLVAIGKCDYASGCDIWTEEAKFYDTKSPQWQGGGGPYPEKQQISLSELGGKKAILIKGQADTDAEVYRGEYSIQYNVFLGNAANEHLTLTFAYNSQNQDNNQILDRFNQILSTFKFTQ